MFQRTIRMINNGIKPIFVFDGKPPTLKSVEVTKQSVEMINLITLISLPKEVKNVRKLKKAKKKQKNQVTTKH